MRCAWMNAVRPDAACTAATGTVAQTLLRQPPGGLGLTGVGGVSWRSGAGTGSVVGGAGNWMGGSNGGVPFMPWPLGDGGTVTCG